MDPMREAAKKVMMLCDHLKDWEVPSSAAVATVGPAAACLDCMAVFGAEVRRQALEEVIKIVKGACACDESYTSRGHHESACSSSDVVAELVRRKPPQPRPKGDAHGIPDGRSTEGVTPSDGTPRRFSGGTEGAPQRPKVVTLCGSTRFMDAFFEQGWKETLEGRIVLSVGVAKHLQTDDGGHAGEALGPEVCAMLDELHKRKIDLSDEILVLNVGGYVGESTRGEIEYAQRTGKRVRWLEPRPAPSAPPAGTEG